MGSQSTTFNVPGVRENASFLKEIPDAEQIREKMKFNLAKAAHLKKDDPEKGEALKVPRCWWWSDWCRGSQR